MKKTLIILAVVIPVILLIAYIRTPVTPPHGPSYADSYDALRALFRDHDEVFVPEEDEIPVQSLQYILDRNRCNPKPYYYLIQKLETDTDCQAEYELECEHDLRRKFSIDGPQSYRGVAYCLSYHTPDLEKDGSVVLQFNIGDAYYDFCVKYCGQGLNEAEIEEMNARFAAQLETYTKQVIDQYRQKTPE